MVELREMDLESINGGVSVFDVVTVFEWVAAANDYFGMYNYDPQGPYQY